MPIKKKYWKSLSWSGILWCYLFASKSWQFGRYWHKRHCSTPLVHRKRDLEFAKVPRKQLILHISRRLAVSESHIDMDMDRIEQNGTSLGTSHCSKRLFVVEIRSCQSRMKSYHSLWMFGGYPRVISIHFIWFNGTPAVKQPFGVDLLRDSPVEWWPRRSLHSEGKLTFRRLRCHGATANCQLKTVAKGMSFCQESFG